MSFLGKWLRGVRANHEHLVWNQVDAGSAADLRLSSPGFSPGGLLPRKHAGAGVGDNVSPALSWSGVPANAKELVLVIEDPDAPLPRPVVHAIAFGISPSAGALPEGALSVPTAEGHRRGRGSFNRREYAGPRPVRGHGPHTYVFQLFALDRRLGFEDPPNKKELVKAMRGAVIARGRLDGVYER